MRGAAPKAVQELVGHSTLTMTLRYMHLAPSALREAVALLDFGHPMGIAEEASAQVCPTRRDSTASASIKDASQQPTPRYGVNNNFKRHATLRANAAKYSGKLVRIALPAGTRQSTSVELSWAFLGIGWAMGCPPRHRRNVLVRGRCGCASGPKPKEYTYQGHRV